MKRILAGAAWLVALVALGGLVAAWWLRHLHGPAAFAPAALHNRAALGVTVLWLGIGAGAGFGLFGLLGAANLLPGVRTRRSAGPVWDLPEAAFLLINFFTMQVLGSAVCAGAILLIVTSIGHEPVRIFTLLGEVPVIVCMAMSGYLLAVLFTLRYVRRAGPVRLHDGSARGLGWRAAPRGAYGVAAGLAVGITLLVMLLYHIFPVSPAALQSSPLEQAFGTPGWPAAALVILALFLAPPAEELVFRGGVFAGLATRLGPWGAAIGSTLLFMAAHAQEKLHYLPGFIDVGLVAAAAAWLRLRYGSIRPGIALHLLYNLGVTLASATLGG
jgi:membrane protease YdiL (CAAX protease family)